MTSPTHQILAENERLKEENVRLRAVLAEAMCKLHGHIIHAGTRFEDEALALFGAEPPCGLGYREAWEALRDGRWPGSRPR